MASYAIASVKQKIKLLLNSQSSIPKHLPFRDIVCFYDDLSDVELVISWHRRKKLKAIDLEQHIEDVVDQIEDLIGSHFSSFQDFIKAKQEISRLKDKLKKGEYKIEIDPPPSHFLPTAEDDVLYGRYDSILGSCPDPLGMDEEIQYIKYRVMRGSSKLKATIVVGMAGCGKTTLVKQVYSELMKDFDLHFMSTIRQNFTLRQILVYLLATFGIQFDGEISGESELGMLLTNLLKGKRYLCVLDNLWDPYACQRLFEFFPDEHNGSRIICTSRDAMILPGGNREVYFKNFLEEADSWKLLRNVVFTPIESTTYKLEEVGKKIAKKCEGLPLAIISMGKLLRGLDKTVERWEKVYEDDDPFHIKKYDGQSISKSLYLSYDMLPYHLKMCFLYMGVLPQNYVIRFSLTAYVIDRRRIHSI